VSLDDWLAGRRDDRAAAGLSRRLQPRPAHSDLVDLAGNDYLGLATDPRVTAAAAEAALMWGAGAAGSRLVSGALTLHTDLEERLASFSGRPAALVFSTGYQANLAAVTVLADPDTLVVSDAHVHASLIDACRLARHGGLIVVAHNDVAAVEAALAGRRQRRALVIVESVYSVLGDAAPLAEIAAVARRLDATLIVDEAHAIGVAGPRGRGLVAAAGLADDHDVVTTMTLSKALGSQGGAVLGTAALVDELVNTARPFIFDTGLAPAATAAATTALDVVASEPDRPARALSLGARMAASLQLARPAAAVLSVPMAGPREALDAQAQLAGDGFRVGCFRPPSVPDGVSRLRLTSRATLSDDQADLVVDRLSRVAAER
jgi:8-amino-7-oxononanoate synthase